MHVLKKPESPRARQWIPCITGALLLICLFIITSVHAAGISINKCSTYRQGDTYMLTANIQYDFSKEALDALRHGIAIQINTTLRLKKVRKWLWDPVLRETVLRFRMEHHPLSGHYVVSDLLTGVRHTYQTLQAAVGFLAELKNITFFNVSLLEDGESYTGQMRTRLDIESLPASLRPIAYLSSNWQLSSPWYSWEIKQ